VHGISIGGGAPTLADGDIQVVDISGNIFRRVIAEGLGTSVAGRIIVVTGGKTININNNKMIDCSAFGGHGIYTVGVSPQVIDFVKINGNFIDGSEEIGLGAGIYIRSGRYDITNNTFSGRILTGQPITSFITTQGTIQGNSYINEDENEQPLPDYLSSTTGEFNISFAKDTSSAIDTITTMLVNPGGSYPYSINGSAGFWVTVEVSNSTEQSVYEYYAWATNDTTSQDTTVSKYTETKDEFSYSEEVEDLAEIKIGGKPVATEQDTTLYYVENVSFGIDTLTSTVINGSDDPLQLFWQNIGGASTPAGHLRRLEIYCDKPETIYKVKVKFLGYRLQPYYMTY
jgi:hypothetical protein